MKHTKRILSLLLSMVLVLSLLPALPTFADEYYLYVGGTKVTDANKADILGHGEASYDSASNTLTLKKDITYNGIALLNRISGLTVYVENDVTVRSSSGSSDSIYSMSSIKFTGPGKLTAVGPSGMNGITVTGSSSKLTIEDANVEATGYNGIHGNGTQQLLIKKSSVRVVGSDEAIKGFGGGITLEGCSLTVPAGGYVLGGGIVDAGGNPALEVTVEARVEYDLRICGTQVTSENAGDVLGGGEVSYDPVGNRLSVRKDLSCDTDTLIYTEIPDLTLYVENDVTLSSTSKALLTIRANTRLVGSGKLTGTTGYWGVSCGMGTALSIEDLELELTAGGYGITTESTPGTSLTIQNCKLHVSSSVAAISDFATLTIDPGLAIVLPAGGYVHEGDIVKPDGYEAKEVRIEPFASYDLRIVGTNVTNANAADILGGGEFSYDAASNTLSIHKSYTSTAADPLIRNAVSGLTIRVENDVTLDAGDKNVIDAAMDTVITGPGKLSAVSTAWGIGCAVNTTVTIEDADLDFVVDGYGITTYGDGRGTNLTIRSSNLHVKSTGERAVCDFASIDLDPALTIVLPVGGRVWGSSIVDADDNDAKEVLISPRVSYELWISGTQVTSDNAADILGDGAFSYDAAANRLTIKKDYADAVGTSPIICNKLSGLEIYTPGDVTLEVTKNNGLEVYADTTITGPGKLSLHPDYNAIIFWDDAKLTITDAKLDLTGSYGITAAGAGGYGKVTIKNSAVCVDSTDGGICYLASIDIAAPLSIISPAGAAVVGGNIEKDGVILCDAVIGELVEYGLWVAGVRVTSANAADVLGGGEASYDDGTKTLTLSKDFSTTDYLVNNWVDGLTIYVAGNVTLRTSSAGIEAFKNTTITGPGKLTVNAKYALYFCGDVTMTLEDADVDASGTYGVWCIGVGGTGDLVVKNATLHAVGLTAAICEIHSITLSSALLTKPEGGQILGGAIYEADGTTLAKEVTIEPAEKYQLWVAGVQATSANAADILGGGEADYDAASRTLTIKKSITCADKVVYNYWVTDLTVVVANDATLHSTGNVAVECYDRTMITGPGKLTLVSDTDIGLYVRYPTTLQDLELDVTGATWGITGASSMTAKRSKVHAAGPNGAICLVELTLEGCQFSDPADGKIVDGDAVDAGGTVLAEVTIDLPPTVWYTVTFNANGHGTAPAAQTVEFGTPATDPADPTASGWIFGGWYTEVACTNPYDFATPVTADITLYAKWTETYALWIAGTQVTSLNAANVLGDGKFSYDASTKTLTISGSYESATSTPIIRSEVYGLIIRPSGDVTLKSTGSNAILVKANAEIDGPDKITMESPNNAAVLVMDGAHLNLRGVNLDVSGLLGISGYSSGEKLYVHYGSTVHVVSRRTWETVNGFTTIEIADSLVITTPAGGYVSGTTIVDADGHGINELMIEPVKSYNLTVKSVIVTNKNASDILGDGAASYDEGTNTLTIRGDIAATTNCAVRSDNPDLTIYMEKDATLSYSGTVLMINQNTTVTGPGKLTVKTTNFGFYVDNNKTLTVKDANVDVAESSYGIGGRDSGHLVIENSSVHAAGTTAAISGLQSVTLTPPLAILAPEGASVSGGRIVDGSGYSAKEVTIGIPPTIFTVTFDANGHGTAPAAQTVEAGKTATEPAAPTAEGWTFGGWYTEAECTNKYDFATPVTANITLFAKWTENAVPPVWCIVTFELNGHGAAIPAQAVENGKTAVRPADPTEEGWTFGGWYTEAECVNAYDFATPVTANITLFAKWTKQDPGDGLPCTGGEDCPGAVFKDMPPKGDWAHDAIDWAVVYKITTGTSATTFSPEDGCTRAQVVTFLWRAAGEPEPTVTDNPFTDVAAGTYYYKAVLWAVERKVTTGTSTTTFSPEDTCTRAQIVTFLWRYEGEPAATTESNPFTDVTAGSYYEKAVLWASETGVTTGTSATSFSPEDTCTRAQVVTFLYRVRNART